MVRLKNNGTNHPLSHQGSSLITAEQLGSAERQHHRQSQVPRSLLTNSGKQGSRGGLSTVPEGRASDPIAALPLTISDIGVQASDKEHPGTH